MRPSAADGAARRAPGLARARRVFLRLWVTGCAGIVVAVLLYPMTGGASLVVMVLAGGLVMAPCGFGVGCVALAQRSRASLHALLVAAVSLVAAIALVPVALQVGMEVAFAPRQAELDALAPEIRRSFAVEGAGAGPDDGVDVRVTDRFRSRLNDLDVSSVHRTDGGLVFSTRMGGAVLLYADEVPYAEGDCAAPRLRALGGRWFERRCGPARGWLD
jgi:hypothetical protein